ncbi:hypothetical protein [Prevotella lacticifex]|uniref:Uncharacterized protein n=1 Tax=Prevotella lacticifex TaxID=2854755 RepID=A0A9R1CBQ0_9BACT|nr:hypothetical protein [Prevotella lacticifex]GJG36685.1 hypothetical protein PRLR5003_18420 [Prevotella lacticifex]GJG38544.1 hypothetical protein PRLR5019_05150 [Prevotella lacticifex]GJG42773.1 hypothetical protein PRLR5025_15590 [Prevotella lacticifex]GJG44901.1 hypothetical protein PRLR5027_04960 [Prevotella lacticifex]GJG49124.1 hypothetical protein PRLR5052_15370 [Prevotella lacticifex]
MKKYIKPAIRIKAIAEDCSILAASGIVGQDKATITFSSENIVNPEGIGAKHNIWDPEDTEEQE